VTSRSQRQLIEDVTQSDVYLTTSSLFAPSSPKTIRKRNVERSDSIRLKGIEKCFGAPRWLGVLMVINVPKLHTV
jgi:hypothetical protein